MTIDDSGPGLRIEVTDSARAEPTPEPLTLALLQGLADRVDIRSHQGICDAQVHLEWHLPGLGPTGTDRVRIPDQGPF